jgi:hypothetical protein
VLTFVLVGSAQAQFVSEVNHRNTDSDAPEDPQIGPDPLDEDVLVFVDRTHEYNEIPGYLIGAQVIMTANDNKNVSAYELDLTIIADCTVYVFVDNRMGGAAGGLGVDPVITGMGWLEDEGYTDTGDDIGIDESGDGDIDQYSSVFAKPAQAGTVVTIRGNTEGHGGNMLSVALQGPRLNAYDPVPEDGAVHTNTWITTSWTPGDTAVSHDVYFSDNFDDVNDGTADAFVGNQTTASLIAGFVGFPFPDGLIPGTTYYWRVDEIEQDGTKHVGDVWSFSIPQLKAHDPSPPDGSPFVATDTELSWTAGLNAKLHTVYFGKDFDTVANATGGSAQNSTTFTTGQLTLGTTYYWRVDELDPPTTHTGDVWSFTTVPDIPVSDPSLLCWWKFDEEAGSAAVDYSGHGHHGSLEGDTKWVYGKVGGALEFDGTGDRVVDYNAASYLNGLDAITVCMWIKSDLVGTDKGFLNGEEPDGGDNLLEMRYDAAGATAGGTNVIKMAVVAPGDEQQLESSNNLQTTEWQHVTMTWSRNAQLELYVNGNLDTPSDNGPARDVSTEGITMLIVGQGGKDAGGGWDGLIDDVRIYNRVLTAEEITVVMRGEPDLAWNPSPSDRSTPDITDATPLSWSPGDLAVQHDVYFGIDDNAVDSADASDTSGVYRGRQNTTSYVPPEGVEWGGGPYYWRIDEFNTDGTVSRGRTWSFTVADFLLVDGFESYTDNDAEGEAIWQTWLDGFGVATNGSQTGYTLPPYAEQTIVHSGGQSMPLQYNNTAGVTNSQVERELDSPRDWTAHGVEELSIWFQGRPPSVGSFVEGPVGTFTMTATGADIWNDADQFHYAYRTLTGVGSIEAKVLSVENTNTWAKCGVMIRETLDPGSKFAAVYVTPTNTDGTATNGVRFQARAETDADATSDSSIATAEQMDLVAPQYVKIERDVAGNFRGYYSSDGVNWTPMAWNPQSIPMEQTVYIGLALTSHTNAAVCEAQFSNVRMTGTVSPTWSSQDIGIAANDAEPFYVAISNATGAPAVVTNENPDAANVETWTPWVIPLQKFTDQGINLADVDKIAIGLGATGGASTGGSGIMFIDDIRLYRPGEAPVSP